MDWITELTNPEAVRRRIYRRSAVTETGCREWNGPTDKDGYGRLWVEGRTTSAHRASWLSQGSQIPDGMVLDHLCRNRLCVNVDHLEVTTNLENIRRGEGGLARPGIRGCRKHALSEGKVWVNKRGERRWSCRPCGRERLQRHRSRNK